MTLMVVIKVAPTRHTIAQHIETVCSLILRIYILESRTSEHRELFKVYIVSIVWPYVQTKTKRNTDKLQWSVLSSVNFRMTSGEFSNKAGHTHNTWPTDRPTDGNLKKLTVLQHCVPLAALLHTDDWWSRWQINASVCPTTYTSTNYCAFSERHKHMQSTTTTTTTNTVRDGGDGGDGSRQQMRRMKRWHVKKKKKRNETSTTTLRN